MHNFMIYYFIRLKTTAKSNTALWLPLFSGVHLHAQAAVFPRGILCARYLFFLLKKKKAESPTFVSIALLHSL